MAADMSEHTVFVSRLPTTASNERLEEIFSEIGPVKQCFVVNEKGTQKCRGFGYVTYSMTEDVQRAMKEIKEYDGQKITLCVSKKKMHEKKKPALDMEKKKNEHAPKGIRKNVLKARLIIRNLSFQCSENDLKQVCTKFGPILEAKIPLKPDGKMRGFAFVQFKNMSSAAKALNALNLKEIKGRQVAVDWAVPKDRYVATQSSSSAEKKNTLEEAPQQSNVTTVTEDDNKDEEMASAGPPKKKVLSKPATRQEVESPSDDEASHEEEDDTEEDDVSLDDDDGDEDDDDDDDDKDSEDDDDKDSDDDDNDSDDDDDVDEGNDEKDKSAQKKTVRKDLPSDVKEGRTIFIRNLSFDTEEEDLEKVLLQFGELKYVKIVMQPETEHSKGCAFAQFRSKESADQCIAAAQDESECGGIRVDGRKLFIVTAVSKEDAVKMKVNKVKVETGTRNLYLAREGLIRAGTKAAEGVSETDMIKRTRFEELKRAKLRDLNVYVSKTRLCIHNLPKSVDSKKLKALCLQAVKGNKGVFVNESRVMYDKKPLKGQVMGQSLGYGFVQFKEHEHALGALRYLNNNPNIFGPNKRPIVEFSLEDSRKLKIKELRQQKYKETLKGASQSQMTREKKIPGTDINTQESSELPSQGKGVKDPSVQMTAPRGQTPNKSHLGFVTNPEVEHIELQNGKKRRKVLAFPSHRGPKIRMRDRGKQKVPPPKKTRPGMSRKAQKIQQMEKPRQLQKVKTAKKPFKNRNGDHFESLVSQYKKKLMASSDKGSNMKRNKWFDSL
ncbi:RNA-binding protein 28 isoform X1 [Takifugu rubripes]|nr:RNA-binding protein 28 isoform X1 [Takifugu rubripes]